MPSNSEAKELFTKLVKKESELALKCIKSKVSQEELEHAVCNFLKTQSAQKIYAKVKNCNKNGKQTN